MSRVLSLQDGGGTAAVTAGVSGVSGLRKCALVRNRSDISTAVLGCSRVVYKHLRGAAPASSDAPLTAPALHPPDKKVGPRQGTLILSKATRKL